MSDLSGSQDTKQTASGFDSAKLTAYLSLILFAMFLIFHGCCIAGFVLKEPDICFLLASGRWIVEHGHLPLSDPFSYTTHFHPVQYVIEKWLTEIIFYQVIALFGTLGLLIFDGCLLALAFVVLPMRILYLGGFRGLALLFLTALTTLVSFSHLAVRPEVFSFLIAACFLEIILRVSRATAGNARIQWWSIALLGVLSCLWANLHTLFIVAIMLPAMYSGCLIVEKILIGQLKKEPLNLTMPIAFIVCTLATLVNPYGFGLWLYIPNVFGPFNDNINEMQPIRLATALSPAFLPFYAMAVITVIALFKRLRGASVKQGDLFFSLLVPAGILAGFKTIRSIPMSDLFMVTGLARLKSETDHLSAFVKRVDAWLVPFANPFRILTPVFCLLLCTFGIYLTGMDVGSDIPQGCAAFKPPVEGVKYIAAHRPSGHLLNDPHFGNVMMWQLKDAPPVFIDSRYNLFGNNLLRDYWTMAKCESGFESLLDKYEIDWLFLPPDLPISKRLSELKGAPDNKTLAEFKRLYSDSESVIYARNQTKDKP